MNYYVIYIYIYVYIYIYTCLSLSLYIYIYIYIFIEILYYHLHCTIVYYLRAQRAPPAWPSASRPGSPTPSGSSSSRTSGSQGCYYHYYYTLTIQLLVILLDYKCYYHIVMLLLTGKNTTVGLLTPVFRGPKVHAHEQGPGAPGLPRPRALPGRHLLRRHPCVYTYIYI